MKLWEEIEAADRYIGTILKNSLIDFDGYRDTDITFIGSTIDRFQQRVETGI